MNECCYKALPELRFGDIATIPDTRELDQDGRPFAAQASRRRLKERRVDLIVSVLTPYVAGNAERNGLNRGFGVINVACGTMVELAFAFVDRETSEPVRMPLFEFSFYELDAFYPQWYERISVSDYTYFVLPKYTRLSAVAKWRNELQKPSRANVSTRKTGPSRRPRPRVGRV